MIWQYRTIIFEFAKDGLLGERYINDEEMENTLNEQGSMGWELVSAVMVQDGVLAVLKRTGTKVVTQKDRSTSSESPLETDIISVTKEDAITSEQVRQQEQESGDHGHRHIGDIKIS